jgi:hypothetical protein
VLREAENPREGVWADGATAVQAALFVGRGILKKTVESLWSGLLRSEACPKNPAFAQASGMGRGAPRQKDDAA